MTLQPLQPRRSNAFASSRRTGSVVLVAALGLALVAGTAGCEKKKKKLPPPPPPPPPVVETPQPIDINGVLAEMKPDARVKFAGDTSPADRSLAEGVIHLADYLAKGDSLKLKGMLDQSGQTVLDELVSNGSWADETKKIEQVRVVYLSDTTEAHPDSATVATAIQDSGGAYLLGWTLHREGDSPWKVSAAPTPADFKSRASDFDGQRISAASTSGSPSDSGSSETASASSPNKKADAPGDAPAKPADDDGTRKKYTPGGPIRIPTRTPGGG